MVWVMYLAHHCLPKVAKSCQKKPKVNFCVNCNTGSDDTGWDDTGTASLDAGQRLTATLSYQIAEHIA